MKYKGLNEEHIRWHLMEIYKPERFDANLNSVYTMPSRINYISLAEGKDFDALLVDDKMFRYTKLNEEDRDMIQDYINRYAYATALVKLNECSNVIGCGLSYNYSTDEAYDFISRSYDKLFENIYITKEKGKLVESFSNEKLKIYDGSEKYIRSVNDSKLIEDWENTFNHKFIKNYYIESVNQNGTETIINFVDNFGRLYETHYANTDSKLLEFGVNPEKFLNKKNLTESFRVGTLTEYQQPFTLHYAVITSYNKNENDISLGVLDAFGNSGTINLSLNISVDEFDKKYGDALQKIVKADTFGERLDLTNDFFAESKDDVASVGKIKGRQVSERNKENQLLSYKIYDFIPDLSKGDVVIKSSKSKEKFLVRVKDSNGKEYNISYLYTSAEPIKDFIDNINTEADEYDFTNKSDIVSFYQLLDDYGDILGSYPTGISTSGRNYPKKEGDDMLSEQVDEETVLNDFNTYLMDINISPEQVDEDIINDYFTGMFYEIWDNNDLDDANEAERIIRKKYHCEDKFNESEGVQTTDIAPKVDQDLGLVKVKMKKRGKITEEIKSDLLINMISEKDAFYGARGFIKDEFGRYHFNDYYLTESGKVVHKSKLDEVKNYINSKSVKSE